MIFKFYLDGNLVEDPVGWDDMVSVIKRDRVLKGQFITMDVTFTFDAKGYSYLKSVFDSQGYCAEVLLRVEQSIDEGNNFITFYDGIIKISDVQFMVRGDNLSSDITVKQYARTKVLDNSFFSRIYNNRKLKTNICAGKTKNGLDITPCNVDYLEMFEPATGVYLGAVQKEAILWHDAFRYLVEFMTDAEVTFDSELLVNGDFSQCILTYGLPIFKQGGGVTLTDADFIANLPKISFEDFFHEIDVRVNLGLYIDNSGVRPKVKIEKWDDLFKTDSSVQINNINEVKTRISVEDIFSKLKLGTTETIESLGALNFPETINYLGFKKEEYIVTGKCGLDTELDLTGDFVTASNVIEEILINNPALSATPNEEYNKKFFLIDAEFVSSGLYRAVATNWLDPTSSIRYYNERFTNSNVANNYLKAVPNTIADYLGGVLDASFLAIRTFDTQSPDTPPASTFSLDPVEFDNDSVAPAFDSSNVYDNALNQFQVPALGAGVYSFSSFVDGLFNYNTIYPNTGFNYPLSVRTSLWLDRYDSLSTLLNSYRIGDVTHNYTQVGTGNWFANSKPFNVQGSGTINLNDGDIIKVRLFVHAPNFGSAIAVNPYKIWTLHGSNFACTGNTTGGGNYQRYNPDDYPIIEDSFEQELSKTKFDLIASKPLSLIEFSQGSETYKKGWIKELRYNHSKGMGSFKLLSAKNTN